MCVVFLKEFVYVLLKITDCEFNIKMMIINSSICTKIIQDTNSCMLLFVYILSCLVVIISLFKVNKVEEFIIQIPILAYCYHALWIVLIMHCCYQLIYLYGNIIKIKTFIINQYNKSNNKTLLQYILSFRNQHAFDNIWIAIDSLLYAYPL